MTHPSDDHDTEASFAQTSAPFLLDDSDDDDDSDLRSEAAGGSGSGSRDVYEMTSHRRQRIGGGPSAIWDADAEASDAPDGEDEEEEDEDEDEEHGSTQLRPLVQSRSKRRRRQRTPSGGSGGSVASFQLYTPDEDRAVRRKFDRRLVLFVALLYMLSFLDRSSRSIHGHGP